MQSSPHTQMLALLRYHYRDPDMAERPDEDLIRLFAEMQWVREKEREASEAQLNQLNGTAHR